MLTAGLSPSAGEHAGKWVTVSTVCLPHICFTSTLSALRKRSTSRQRTKTASKCGNSLRQSLCAEWRCSEMTHDATSPLSCFPMRGFTGAEWKHFWWSVAGRMMVPRQSQYSGDEVRLSNSVGSNQGNFQDEKKKKKLLRINVCVLCWEVWFTHMAAEETCCSEGDSVVLPEHNC